ncbi:MAG: carbon starvation protein A [Erysipelotrichia bacterium]|nr:carbon starvation protein A [Erysipelotrichia bacterium]
MKGLLIIAIAMIVLFSAYKLYGTFLEKTWGIDVNAKTPATIKEDGVDYIPTPKFVVFAHQFSSIAGAGPITGPIIALMFGWLPALIWLLVGGIFFGAVQDFGSLYASVKNEGKSMGMIIEQYIGKTGRKLFMLFCWLFTLLVIAAFVDIVAGTFNGLVMDTTGKIVENTVNGSVASISLLFIVAAVGFGFFIHYKKPSQKMEFIIGLVLFLIIMALGIAFPVIFEKNIWIFVIFAYIFAASVTPMWALMQPRDYLSTFLFVAMIVAAVVGLVVANPVMESPAFVGLEVNGQYIFPVLFVTIACGAVSGFHSLVSSGTSSKQIANEKDMKLVGFGSMLLEVLLAIIALVVASSCIGSMPAGSTPFQIFSYGVTGFLSTLGLPTRIVNCFIAMALSALALTSLDSVARIGRMSFQELFENEGKETKIAKVLMNKHVATLITLVCGYFLCVGGYQNIWPLFGASNQLLSALVLISISVFLKVTGRKGFMLWIPMTIMLVVTLSSLGLSIYNILNAWYVSGSIDIATSGLQLIIAVLLVVLGVSVAFFNLRKLKNA